MADFREDTVIWPVLVDLLGCIQTELEESGLDPVANYSVATGAEPPALDMGDDCNGYVWTRLADSFPSRSFPSQDTTPGGRAFASTIEVGIARCVSIGDPENPDSGAPIPAEATFEDARIQLADKAALYRAICKCLAKRDFLVQNYVVSGPFGGVVYSGWAVTVGGMS